MTDVSGRVIFCMVVLAALVGALVGGCASAPLDHDSIDAEVQPLFERAKQDAIANYRRQWGSDPIVPYMIINVADKPMIINGRQAAGWTTGNRATIARQYIILPVVTHEVGHIIKNRNNKGQGEDHL